MMAGRRVARHHPEPHMDNQIPDLEERIEELTEAIARSEKFLLAGKIGAGLGAVLLLAMMIGLLRFTPVGMVLGITLGIGGVVLTGSSKTTTENLQAALGKAEAARTAAIDNLSLLSIRDDDLRLPRH
jgi:hypothetical protein